MLALGLSLRYVDLYLVQRKGLRNGNWRRLKPLERSLYRAALALAKIRGKLVNLRLVRMMLDMAERLQATFRTTVLAAGLAKAREMEANLEARGLFNSFQRLRGWLKEPSYIFWLGLCQTFP